MVPPRLKAVSSLLYWEGTIMVGRRFTAVCIGILLAAVVGLTISRDRVQAQSSIEILSDGVTIEYPYSIEFSLLASSAGASITSVRIFWRAGPGDTFHVSELRVHPDHTINVRFPLNAQGLSLPPFTQIFYRWEIRDAQGSQLVTENQTVEYEDTRHDWEELANEHLRLLSYGLDAVFARELFGIADAAYLRLAEAFGVELDQRPVVLIYTGQRDFAEFQRFLNNLEYVVGRYFPGHNVTVNLVTPEMDRAVYESTIAHELSHLYSDNFYVGYARIPLWLEEGLATYNEALNRQDDLQIVQRAAAHGDLVPFIDLPRAIRHPNIQVANLAYNEGATVLLFIEETWGSEGLVDFLTAFRRTTSVDRVTQDVFGLDIVAFELAWREWLGFPVEMVPQVVPTLTLQPINRPTPTFAFPGG